MTSNYAYGHNEPGCLPDNPAFVAESFADAKAGVIWDLKFFEDYAGDEDEATDFCHAAEDVNLWSATDRDQAWSITVANRAFWIQVTDEDADR